MTDPLILTLEMDPALQARLEADRERWFPPGRNLVPAHVTLFHALPGDSLGRVMARLARVASGRPAPAVRIDGPMSLGRGAAWRLDIAGFDALREEIGAGFALSDQDRGRKRAHVTVQNKVTKEEASRTIETMRAEPPPPPGRAIALALWHYRGGPWDAAGMVPFHGPGPDAGAQGERSDAAG